VIWIALGAAVLIVLVLAAGVILLAAALARSPDPSDDGWRERSVPRRRPARNVQPLARRPET
jgi:hypothetical protein